MLNRPARNARAIPSAASVTGVAAVNVSEIAGIDPKEPWKSARNERPIVGMPTPVASIVTPLRTSAISTARIGTRTICSISNLVTTARLRS
jgi:hypothetical protein